MDSVALALFRFFSRTRQKAGAAVRAPGAAPHPHPHPHPHECNYADERERGLVSKFDDIERKTKVKFVRHVHQDSLEQSCKVACDLVVRKRTSWWWWLWNAKEHSAGYVCEELDQLDMRFSCDLQQRWPHYYKAY